MAWYRAGTVSVTNGSATVTGAGTDFVSNASIGEAFLGPDGRAYEITQVVSATQIVLGMPYQGAGAGGQGYAVLPTQSFARDLARGAAELLNTFAAVRDGVGQGLFPDGAPAAPGMRFTGDQDTGVRRYEDNGIAVVTGGTDRMRISGSGDVGVMTGNMSIVDTTKGIFVNRLGLYSSAAPMTVDFSASTYLRFIAGSDAAERMRIDQSGNLLVGTSSGSNHLFAKSTSEGSAVFQIVASASGTRIAQFNGTAQEGFNGARAALWLGKDSTTGRSGGFAGTVNASGADYAEYILKAAGCGIIAKGDVCGVDRDGRLTKTWADAVSFVIKSTDPSLVGGDTWDAEVGPKPEEPGAEPAEPSPPAPPAEDADDATIAAWRDAMAAYPARVTTYQAARAEWQKATDAYDKALPVWEAAHEKARQCVDRIAFCGQVPANVSGDFEVGDYIIAAVSGAGIKAVALKEDDMTLPQYMRRIGKVWAIRDGRAWIDVQHG